MKISFTVTNLHPAEPACLAPVKPTHQYIFPSAWYTTAYAAAYLCHHTAGPYALYQRAALSENIFHRDRPPPSRASKPCTSEIYLTSIFTRCLPILYTFWSRRRNQIAGEHLLLKSTNSQGIGTSPYKYFFQTPRPTSKRRPARPCPGETFSSPPAALS